MSSVTRIVMAKPGLDGHDRGVKVVARALMDAGFEVVYTGRHQTPEQIVRVVIQEDADVLGMSILSGAHVSLLTDVYDLFRANGLEDVRVIVGGTIPIDDIPTLRDLGVDGVFTPGTKLSEIVELVRGFARV